MAPTKPADKTVEELFKILNDHYNLRPLVIAEHYIFHSCAQRATESVSEYIAELRKLAIRCEFEAFLAQALRDHFICGL